MGAKRLPPLTIPNDPAILGYIAGIVDGEGCISISSSDTLSTKSRSFSLRVAIANTDERLVQWLAGTLGGGLSLKRKSPKSDQWLPCWMWYAHGRQAGQLLQALLPYLIVKKGQAEVALNFLQVPSRWKGRQLDPTVVIQREEFKMQINTLNARGPKAVA